MEERFKHYQSAHCENGVVSNLLKYHGHQISEPLVFGIGSGLFFVYLPFIKVNHAPGVSFRPMPGFIFKRLSKKLGIKFERQKFKSEAQAQKVLDQKIAEQTPVGLQVGVFNLTYFPDEYRFHFNAHNLIVFGKKDDNYLISDPVMENTTELTSKELSKVRFAKGVFAPKGHMYYPVHIPERLMLENAIVKGIKKTCRDMLAPVPIVGVKGMRYLAKEIEKWPVKKGKKIANHYLGQIVRMQEEIGTGGGGFRFVYAAFLQEASKILNNEKLKELSLEMTDIGDLWRDFAVDASRIYKNRSAEIDVYTNVADKLRVIADKEEAFYRSLRKAV